MGKHATMQENRINTIDASCCRVYWFVDRIFGNRNSSPYEGGTEKVFDAWI